MKVNLLPKTEEFVEKMMRSGRYPCRGDIFNEALILLEEREWIRERRLEELRAEIQKGIDDLEAGRFITIESDEDAKNLFEDIKRRGRERLEKKADLD